VVRIGGKPPSSVLAERNSQDVEREMLFQSCDKSATDSYNT
jgi:hypothetical protein